MSSNFELLQSGRIWMQLELSLCSFVGLEAPHVASTGNRVVGDLYNSVQSRRRVTAERQTEPKVWDGWEQSRTIKICHYLFVTLVYLGGVIMLPRLSPILRLSGKPLSWELDPLCHSFLSPCSLLWRSTTTWRPELNGCRDRRVLSQKWVWIVKWANPLIE